MTAATADKSAKAMVQKKGHKLPYTYTIVKYWPRITCLPQRGLSAWPT